MTVTLGTPVLAIDTATRYAGLALFDGERLFCELTWRAIQNHTTTLMPNLVRMLDQQGLDVTGVGGVAVALGPGSFTGLRIGLSMAKGLSLACGVPLVGVPTLDIVVSSCVPLSLERRPFPIRAILEAGRGRYCAADYEWMEDRLEQRGDYRILAHDDIASGVEEPTLFCGEISLEAEQALRSHLGSAANVVPAASRLRRPGHLAELGWQRLSRGEQDDPGALSPIYLRTGPGRQGAAQERRP
jgi:tRNA threonylcarbamoyladenosine biosynthesis protein TsaB